MHWFYDPGFIQSSTNIAKSELEHFKSLRIRNHEEISVTDGKGNVYVCQVLEPKTGELKVLSKQQQQRSFPSIHLVQALAKGDRDEQAVQASVELGVSSITPWQSELAIVNWSGKEEKSRLRWQEIAISAMKQSQQTFLPEVSALTTTKALRPRGFGIILDPRAALSITDLPVDVEELTIVVGPEGGISAAELEQLSGAGFEPRRLGDSILRTSTAGPAAIAAILTKLQIW